MRRALRAVAFVAGFISGGVLIGAAVGLSRRYDVISGGAVIVLGFVAFLPLSFLVLAFLCGATSGGLPNGLPAWVYKGQVSQFGYGGAPVAVQPAHVDFSDAPYMAAPVDAPCGCGRWPLAGAITHLNDHHDWTREQIADWLDTLPLDMRLFPTEEKAWT